MLDAERVQRPRQSHRRDGVGHARHSLVSGLPRSSASAADPRTSDARHGRPTAALSLRRLTGRTLVWRSRRLHGSASRRKRIETERQKARHLGRALKRLSSRDWALRPNVLEMLMIGLGPRLRRRLLR